jgi:hypothetical protein
VNQKGLLVLQNPISGNPVLYRDESIRKLIDNDSMRYEKGMKQVMAENLELAKQTNQHIMMKKGKKKRKTEI